MSAVSAICVHCGKPKPRALGKCEVCGFLPSSPTDAAHSLILSRQFDAGEEVVGLPPEELNAVARQIQGGTPYQFNPELVAKVTALHEEARSLTPRRLVKDLVRWLLPPAILLLGMYWVIWHH